MARWQRLALVVLATPLAADLSDLPPLPVAEVTITNDTHATGLAPTPAPTAAHVSVYHRLQEVQEHLGLADSGTGGDSGGEQASPAWWSVRCDNLRQRLRLDATASAAGHRAAGGSPAWLLAADGTTVGRVTVHRRHSSPSDTTALWRELSMLEYLRGRYGVPTLVGACVGPEQALIVTQQNCTTPWEMAFPPGTVMDKWRALRVAFALTKLFQEVSEFGSVFVADLRRDSLCVDEGARGLRVSLLDVRQLVLLDGSVPAPAELRPVVDMMARQGKSCATGCGRVHDAHSAGCGRQHQPVDCPLSPEATGRCNPKTKRCNGLSFKSHVFDLGRRDWLFPALVQALPELKDVIAQMTAPEPALRPSFTNVLRRLKCVGILVKRPKDGAIDHDPRGNDRRLKREKKYERCVRIARVIVETRRDAESRKRGMFGQHHWQNRQSLAAPARAG